MDFQLRRVEGYQKYIASHHFLQITGYSQLFFRLGTLSPFEQNSGIPEISGGELHSVFLNFRKRLTASGGVPKFSKILDREFLSAVFSASLHPGV